MVTKGTFNYICRRTCMKLEMLEIWLSQFIATNVCSFTMSALLPFSFIHLTVSCLLLSSAHIFYLSLSLPVPLCLSALYPDTSSSGSCANLFDLPHPPQALPPAWVGAPLQYMCVCWGVCGGVEFVDVVMCHSVVVEACLRASRGHWAPGRVSNIRKEQTVLSLRGAWGKHSEISSN